jgi:hypothetical protein
MVSAATSMKWIDAKMEELGMLSNPSFKISMVMDDLAMITVDTPVYGVIEVCETLLLSILKLHRILHNNFFDESTCYLFSSLRIYFLSSS